MSSPNSNFVKNEAKLNIIQMRMISLVVDYEGTFKCKWPKFNSYFKVAILKFYNITVENVL